MANKLKQSFYSLALAFIAHGAVAQQQVVPPGLDDYVSKVLTAFDVPGVSVGIVKDGKIILAKGYGVKKLGDPSPVDENSLFNIASNSKAFTSTAMAMLVEEGKLKWDDKVVDHLPWFKLSDDFVTSHLTLRDLYVHHSGLTAYANDILLFPPSLYTRKELLTKIKDVKLAYDFRTTYAYDNILYLAAAEVIEKISGQTWEDFVKKRIFDVVGMNRSISKYSTLRSQSNVAYAHVRRNGKLEVVDSFFEQNIGDASNAAGGIVSSALDMSKWLITQLDSGRTPDKKRLFKASATNELWKIVRPMPISKEPQWLKPNDRHFSGYALGFRTYDYRKYQVVGHGGLLTGFVSQIAMVPDLNLGVVVLTNQLSSGAYWSIINHILDYNMKAEPFDWFAGYKKEYDNAVKRRDSIQATRTALKGDATLRMTLSPEKYAGMYKDELIGNVVVENGANGLSIRFLKAPLYNADLEHFERDMFRMNYKDKSMGEGPYVNFTLNPDRTINEVRFNSAFSGADGEYERLVLKPDRRTILDTATLSKRIRSEMAKNPEGNFGIAFKDLQTGETVMINEHRVFHAASTMKTPIMVEVYKQAAKGKFSVTDSVTVYNSFKSIVDGSKFQAIAGGDSEQGLYDLIGKKTTIEDLVRRMITRSSNLATNILVDKIGAKNADKTMKSIGVKNMKVLRGVVDEKAYQKGLSNVSTAYDQSLVYERLANGKMIDQKSDAAMVDILLQQQFNNAIPARLPAGVRVAHKTGSLEKVYHDSGIVYLPNGKKYVVILMSDNVVEEKAKKSLATISEYMYNYMNSK
jgi:CubicO group peptidase (beta-lactamase class C family)/beta-lactamase class A